MICNLFSAPTYLVYSPDVPALLYYAHIPTAIVALFFGFYVFRNGRHQLLNRLLFFICILFFCWTIANLVLWTNINADILIFTWSFLGTILGLIAVSCVYFTYAFLDKKDVSRKVKCLFLLLLVPTFALATTRFNLGGFDIAACDAFQFEWPPYKIYSAFLGFLAMSWIAILLVRAYRRHESEVRKQVVLIGVGIEMLLFLFFGMEFLAAFLTKIGALPDSGIEIFGMLGMVVFIIYLNILTVRFGVFNIKLIATQALVVGLAALIGSQFFIRGDTNFILIGVTFVAAVILGSFLVKSVKREIRQKEHLEALSTQLEQTNEKLKGLDKLKTEFLSLASHQLRSPLTAIKGYASMVTEGSFGQINDKAVEAVRRIYASAQGLTNIVEDLLNVSKIEQGGMKYEMSASDLGKIVTDLYNEMKIPAENKKLSFTLDMPTGEQFVATADPLKLKQVFLNLTDNSIKYTAEGFVKLALAHEGGNIIFTVTDSGVGVTAETKAKLFDKFSRGEGGKLNTGGSGLGLYIAREITRAHKGDIEIISDGAGKGAIFKVTIPAK